MIDDLRIQMGAARRDPELSAAIELSSLMSTPDERRVDLAVLWGRSIAWVVCLFGALAMTGWLTTWEGATTVFPGTTPMSFAAGLCLALLGFVFGSPHEGSPSALQWSRVIALSLVAVLAIRSIRRGVIGWTSESDRLWNFDPSNLHMEMPFLLSAALVLLTLAALFTIPERATVSQWLVLPTLVIGVITSTAVLFDPNAFDGVAGLQDFSLLTPFSLLILSVSMLMQTSGTGFVAIGMGNSEGSRIARKIFPLSVLALMVSMYVGFVLYDSGVTSRGLGFGVGTGLVILIGGFLVWFQSSRYHAVDMRRQGAEHVMAQAREALMERDAMARRLGASQQRLRRVLDTSVDAYIAIDDAGCVTEWNDAATTMFGWSYQEAVNTPLDTLILPEEQRVEHRNGLFRHLSAGDRSVLERTTELTAARKDGTPIDVELRVWPIEDRGQTQFHAFIRDVTERKQAQAELERANRELEEFAAVAAHDLRSPLVAISLTAELIVQQESMGHSDTTIDWANRIIDATRRGNELINDLLTLSQISQAPKEYELVDVDTLVRGIAQDALSASDRGGKFDIDPLPPVRGDEVLFRQLFTNLIGNAHKYVPDDREPVVHVRTERTPRNEIVFTLSDNGDGIPEEDLDTVFDMFHRGSNSVDSTGSGIGLAICRRVVEHHNGSITVDNHPEGGARFTIVLPAPSPATA